LIELRSDTFTKPTEAMWRAMAHAEVGDDVYGEDPTVNRLEADAAEWLGKEAALFVPSGTMGNQLAVMTHCQGGDEVLCEAQAHIFWSEGGGIGRLAGAQPRPISAADGRLTADLLRAALRDSDIHYPPSRLVCVENTHNRAGGRVTDVPTFTELAELAHARGLAVHVDGARIANAAVKLGVAPKELVAAADSVQACLSKGLCAPVGSVLAGSREFVARARRGRKVLGGGMRQAGILAAAGLVALHEMVGRLAEDHALARAIAEELAGLDGIACDPEAVETNMVMVDTRGPAAPLVAALERHGLRADHNGPRRLRLVTHRDVAGVSATQVARIFAEALADLG